MPARDAVIVDAVRTPVGRKKGSLSQWHAADLSAHVLRALVDRTGIDPAVVDDVIWGCVQQVGQQSYNVGRMAVLAAGWPRVRAGGHDRPAVRLVPAVGALRRRRPGLRSVRRGRGRRCGDHERGAARRRPSSAVSTACPAARWSPSAMTAATSARASAPRSWSRSGACPGEELDGFAAASHAQAGRGDRLRCARRPDRAGRGLRRGRGSAPRHVGRDAGRRSRRRSSRTAPSTPATPRRSATARPRC